MMQNLKIYFHSFTLFTFTIGALWQIVNLRDTVPENRYVADLLEYTWRYFTLWNLMIHYVYFSLALNDDLNEYSARKSWSFIFRISLPRLKANLFSTLLFPCTAFVSVVFWGYYHYDRDLVFPEEGEYFCSTFTNHVVHTAVGIFALVELFFTGDHPSVRFKNCFIAITAINIIYFIVFFYHYITLGRFLYPVFEGLSWNQLFMLIFVLYLWTLSAAKFGLVVQNYIRTTKLGKSTSWKDVKC